MTTIEKCQHSWPSRQRSAGRPLGTRSAVQLGRRSVQIHTPTSSRIDEVGRRVGTVLGVHDAMVGSVSAARSCTVVP